MLPGYDDKPRPSYVRFERIPVEDKAASLAAGRYVAKDVDYALVTAPGSRDIFKIKVGQWFLNLGQDAANGRIDPTWIAAYKDQYNAWKKGQDLPINGTPIRGWGLISPAMQETCVQANVLTVEDLAALTDEGVSMIGMGACELKNKANAWLRQLQDRGGLALEYAALKNENQTLKNSIAALQEKIDFLLEQSNIGVEQASPKKRGRPPKTMMA